MSRALSCRGPGGLSVHVRSHWVGGDHPCLLHVHALPCTSLVQMSPVDSGGVGMWQQRLLLLPPSTGKGPGARGMFLTGTLPRDHTAAQGWCSGLIGQQELR